MMSEISYILFCMIILLALDTLILVYNKVVHEINCRLEVLYKEMLLVVDLSSQMGVSPVKGTVNDGSW